MKQMLINIATWVIGKTRPSRYHRIQPRSVSQNGASRMMAFCLLFGSVAMAAAFASGARTPQGEQLLQRLAAIKQSSAENKAALQQYSWIETTQIALKGEVKSVKQDACQYGPDGKVQKTPIGAPQEQSAPSGGRLKQKMIAKKKGELEDYMEQVKGLIGLYVPPDPGRMQQAYEAGNVSLSMAPGGATLAFKNYAQPGDLFTLAIDANTKKVSTVNVNTYLQKPSDVVTLAVQFATLLNGPSFASQIVVVATAKQIQVTVTNSNYQKIGGQ